MSEIQGALAAAFGPDRIAQNTLLAKFTTLRVGGPAEWFLETRTSDEMLAALKLASRLGIAVTVLGGGSNMLISDAGIRGLVIRPRGGAIDRPDPAHVRADAAVTINGLVRWMIVHGVAGLEAWAGTPGTVGGAIFGNAHFGGRSIGELVSSVRLAGRDGVDREIPASDMAFAYDRSRLQDSAEVLLSATFRALPGEPDQLRAAARASLAYRKQTQPLQSPSAGCVFQNPIPGRDGLPEGMPYSAGALIDRAGLKNSSIGGARVSPTHGNFIVNDGSATADDIRRLIEMCRDEVREQFGVELRDEIVYKGEF